MADKNQGRYVRIGFALLTKIVDMGNIQTPILHISINAAQLSFLKVENNN